MMKHTSVLTTILLCLCISSLHAIDVVYTWVDNTDIAWQYARKRAYRKCRDVTVDANKRMRFRNRDELKYSLRSLHKFAPFVNHIYIVTCGHAPKWLKPHPKMSIIPHSAIFARKSNLPTFNSHAIESNLHRIPGLSEQYIYLNDDIFFARTVRPSQFFDASGRMKLFFGQYITPHGPVKKRDHGWKAAWKNSNALLDQHFGAQKRYGFYTAPYAFTKSTVHKIEKRFPDVFAQVSSHRFRSRRCCTMTNGLIPYVAWYWNEATAGTLHHKTVFFHSSARANRTALEAMRKERPTTFGIEDMTTKKSQELDVLLHDFLESLFPEKAPWER